MQRLINLKDEEMLALQNKLKGQEDVTAAPEKEEPAASKPAADEDSLFSSDTLMFGGAGLLVLAIIGWMVMKRRRMQEGFEESILNVGMASQVGAAATGMASGNVSSQLMGETGPVSDFAMSDMAGVQSDSAEVDPISEADVYLAYGRHHQAEDILKQAIETSPQRLELHSKLMEVYHASKNAPAFEQHAQVFLEKLGNDESNPLWARVVPLGVELCPGNPLFGGQDAVEQESLANDLGGVSADEEDLLDFDFDAIGDDTLDMGSSDAAGDDDGLDLDVSGLDFDLDADLQQDDRMAKIDALDDNNDSSLDFDLGVDDTSLDMSSKTAQTAASDDINIDALDFTEQNNPPTGFPTAADHKPDLKLDFEESNTNPNEEAAETDFNLDFDLADDSSAAAGEDVDFALDDGGGLSFDEDSVALDDELDDDIFSDVDEIGTKLDLAKAYVDMGDSDGARSILDEVMEEGDANQKQQAEQLLQQMG
jgi:pilus assembly protein FimV